MPLGIQIQDSNNPWSVGCTNGSCLCGKNSSLDDCHLLETNNSWTQMHKIAQIQRWLSLFEKSLEGNFPHHSASGQGTLKLPMSFSKFSLCPPRGAASQGWLLSARFVWQVVTIFSVRTWFQQYELNPQVYIQVIHETLDFDSLISPQTETTSFWPIGRLC